MKERGKSVSTYNRDFPGFNCSALEIPCTKHPYSSHVGICPYCLEDKLVKLVCSECGKRRVSSCSCSDIASFNRKSCSNLDVGGVGRISFLIDNEEARSKSKRKNEGSEERVVFFRRSSSSCVEVKKKKGFWGIKRLFRKERNKDGEFRDENGEVCVSDIIGVSRSRSLRCFRGGKNDFDERSDCHSSTSTKISDVSCGFYFDPDKEFGFSNGYEPRKSGFRSILKGENGNDIKRGGFSNQMEIDRVWNVPNLSVFPIKESTDLNSMDDSAFIDLKLDSMSESNQDFSCAGKINGVSDHANNYENEISQIGGYLANLKGNGIYGKGGSCRITMNERGLKQGIKNHKAWKWIFEYHTAAKEEKDLTFPKILNYHS